MVCKIFFSCVFRRFQSRFDIYSCGQDHTDGYAVLKVKHRRVINKAECLFFQICFELLFALYYNFGTSLEDF